MLTDGIISLRAVEPSDVDTLFLWENDAESWRDGRTTAPMSRMQLWEYANNYTADIFVEGQLRLMIERTDDGSKIGAVDLYDFDAVNRRSGVGLFIGKSFRRQGYALRSLAVIEKYCADRLGMCQLWSIVSANNIASFSLFKNAGYNISGNLHSWIRSGNSYFDAMLFQKILSFTGQ